jgi:hypothetical protein
VLNPQAENSWRGAVCVAELDNVVLPRSLRDVARVNLSSMTVDNWSDAIVDLVAEARHSERPLVHTSTIAPVQQSLPYAELDRDELRIRAQRRRPFRPPLSTEYQLASVV